MSRVTGTYQNGKVFLDRPVDWPEGVPVSVVCENGEENAAAQRDHVDLCVDGGQWQDSPDAIRSWIEWFDGLQPVLTGDELERFDAELRNAKEGQKVLLPEWRTGRSRNSLLISHSNVNSATMGK
jgi:hypothetical protein